MTYGSGRVPRPDRPDRPRRPRSVVFRRLTRRDDPRVGLRRDRRGLHRVLVVLAHEQGVVPPPRQLERAGPVPPHPRARVRRPRHRGHGAFLADLVRPDQEEGPRLPRQLPPRDLPHRGAHVVLVRELPLRRAVRGVQQELVDLAVRSYESVQRGVLADSPSGSKVPGVQHDPPRRLVPQVHQHRARTVVGVDEGDLRDLTIAGGHVERHPEGHRPDHGGLDAHDGGEERSGDGRAVYRRGSLETRVQAARVVRVEVSEEVGDNIGTLIVETVDVEALEAPDALQRPELRRHLGRYVVSSGVPSGSHSAGLPARAASGHPPPRGRRERLMTNHGRCIRATASPRIETGRSARLVLETFRGCSLGFFWLLSRVALEIPVSAFGVRVLLRWHVPNVRRETCLLPLANPLLRFKPLLLLGIHAFASGRGTSKNLGVRLLSRARSICRECFSAGGDDGIF